jgi:hypothetical protein
MTIFGKEADVSVVINDSGSQLTGGSDQFTLGPLTVTGVGAPRASFNINLSKTQQQGTINGSVELFGAE